MAETNKIKQLELLAPAKNAEIGIEAIKHGADAVYIGASKFGARSAAGNSLEDIIRLVNYAHSFNAKVYVTLNTILYDSELHDAELLIADLYRIGVDALIIQDMGILRLNIPPIALHASTQTDIRTPEKAKFLENVGFSQLVLARELSLNEIKAISESSHVPLEVFVHGALCVSYSGRCEISEVVAHRSANRGACCQMCRMAYDLIDDNGNTIISNKHLLSLKDFNLSDNIEELIEAGASSFKIEGRLKDMDYVKNVVAYYRKKIDEIILNEPDKYCRSSHGLSTATFEPNLYKSFNRSFTKYFVEGHPSMSNLSMASFLTPKSQGEYLGKVSYVRNKVFKLSAKPKLVNGDGVSFFQGDEYKGFRVNKVNGNEIIASSETGLKVGDKVYRTFDKDFEDQLSKESSIRVLDIEMSLSYCRNALSLTILDDRGNKVTCAEVCELEEAKIDQGDKQKSLLGKLGNTIYRAREITSLGSYFIQASLLTNLKRKAIALLDKAQMINYKFDYRRPEDMDAKYFCDMLTYADNVSNHLSEKFYKCHGISNIENALEISPAANYAMKPLMNTRYCLRRELGCCMKGDNSNAIPSVIYLRNGVVKLRVEFDCKNCEMKLYKV